MNALNKLHNEMAMKIIEANRLEREAKANMVTTKTTYPARKLAEIKKRGGEWIAQRIFTDLYRDTMRPNAELEAECKVDEMTTRQLYSFLADCGYTFNAARAIWQTADVAS